MLPTFTFAPGSVNHSPSSAAIYAGWPPISVLPPSSQSAGAQNDVASLPHHMEIVSQIDDESLPQCMQIESILGRLNISLRELNMSSSFYREVLSRFAASRSSAMRQVVEQGRIRVYQLANDLNDRKRAVAFDARKGRGALPPGPLAVKDVAAIGFGSVELKGSGGEVEILAFHGSKHYPISVLLEGFNTQLGKRALYGQGSYFAEDPAITDGYACVNRRNDTHYVIASRLLFPSEMKAVPIISPSGVSSELTGEGNESLYRVKINSLDTYYICRDINVCIPSALVVYDFKTDSSSPLPDLTASVSSSISRYHPPPAPIQPSVSSTPVILSSPPPLTQEQKRAEFMKMFPGEDPDL